MLGKNASDDDARRRHTTAEQQAAGLGNVIQNISEVIANVGNAVLENMKAEQDMRLAQSLDTPDRKAFAKEQLALRMAETREKRRRLEVQQYEKEDAPPIVISRRSLELVV